MKIVMRLCAVLCVLQMSSVASAVVLEWNASADQDWANVANWSDGGNPAAAAPTASDETHFTSTLPAAIVSAAGTPSARVVMDGGSALDIAAGGVLGVTGQFLMANAGDGATSTLNVDGQLLAGNVFGLGTSGNSTAIVTVGPTGSINVSNAGAWMLTGHGAANHGELTVNGGTVDVAGFMAAGWAGTGDIIVNGGGSISVGGVMNIGPNPGASGNIIINAGTITSNGLNNASGSLLIENDGTYDNRGGTATGGTYTINGDGRMLFDAAISPLLDVKGLVLGNPAWIFSDTPSITQVGGTVIVTNVPEPTSLILLVCGVCMGVCRRRRA